MSVEDECEETRRALHRMLKDAFEGKLGVFREPFIYGFTTRSREARLETPRPALEGEEIRTRDPLVDVILTESAIFLPRRWRASRGRASGYAWTRASSSSKATGTAPISASSTCLWTRTATR